MLGLPGFVVLAVSEVDGELEQTVETAADLVPCPECGAVAQLHGRRPTCVRDLPAGGRPVMLVWVKRVWRCPYRLCPKRHCCFVRSGSSLDALWWSSRSSDGSSQLGEGCHHPQCRGFLDPEFVVTAAEVLDERMSCADHPC
jgi:hypothetical protein